MIAFTYILQQGMSRKKTRQEIQQELFLRKRSRKNLRSINQQSLDIDRGIGVDGGVGGTIEEESSSGDEGFFTPSNARIRKALTSVPHFVPFLTYFSLLLENGIANGVVINGGLVNGGVVNGGYQHENGVANHHVEDESKKKKKKKKKDKGKEKEAEEAAAAEDGDEEDASDEKKEKKKKKKEKKEKKEKKKKKDKEDE